MKISNINIFDINMVYEMQYDNPPKREKHLFKLIIEKLLILLKYFVGNKLKNNSEFEFVENHNEKIDVLFFGESNNNSLVFNPIIQNLVDVNFKVIKNNKDFPLIKAIYLSFPYTYSLFKQYLKASRKERKIIKSSPFTFLFTYGKYILAGDILDKYSPKILLMANDHSPFNRCLLKNSKSRNIKTIYIQHASVSDKFPPLEFDYSLLDGKESFEKYKEKSKKKSKVILTGSSRYDNFHKTKLNNNRYKIGISLNQFDDFDTVKNLCLNLRKSLKNCELVVRPHPNMIDWNRDWFENENIEYSESSLVTSNVFLKSLKIQISNVSGIHLDAAMIKIPTVLYKLSKEKINDQYQYLANGLIKEAITFENLLNYIKNPDTLLPKDNILQYFLASVGTSIEGRVGEFTANYINSILNDDEEVFEENINLKIYKF